MADNVMGANMNELTKYEKERTANIITNTTFLLSLNLLEFLRYFS
jgi:hypothetical protein